MRQSLHLYDQSLMAGAAQGMTVMFSVSDNGDRAAGTGVPFGGYPATSYKFRR